MCLVRRDGSAWHRVPGEFGSHPGQYEWHHHSGNQDRKETTEANAHPIKGAHELRDSTVRHQVPEMTSCPLGVTDAQDLVGQREYERQTLRIVEQTGDPPRPAELSPRPWADRSNQCATRSCAWFASTSSSTFSSPLHEHLPWDPVLSPPSSVAGDLRSTQASHRRLHRRWLANPRPTQYPAVAGHRVLLLQRWSVPLRVK